MLSVSRQKGKYRIEGTPVTLWSKGYGQIKLLWRDEMWGEAQRIERKSMYIEEECVHVDHGGDMRIDMEASVKRNISGNEAEEDTRETEHY